MSHLTWELFGILHDSLSVSLPRSYFFYFPVLFHPLHLFLITSPWSSCFFVCLQDISKSY